MAGRGGEREGGRQLNPPSASLPPWGPAVPQKEQQTALAKPIIQLLSKEDGAKQVIAPNGASYQVAKTLNIKATAYTSAASENGKWGAVDYFGNPLKYQAVRFKPQDFVWLGSTSPLTNTCVVWRGAEAKTFADARKKEVKIGATSATDATAIVPQFVNAFTGSRFAVTRGYQGTTMIYNAMEKGEIDGVCAAWDSIVKWRPEGVRSPDLRILVQVGAKPDPTLGETPFVMDLAKNDQDRETLRFLTARQAFARPFIAPPGTPADKAASLEAIKFFDWAFAKGDKMAEELDYIPMPAAVTALIRKTWADSIKNK